VPTWLDVGTSAREIEQYFAFFLPSLGLILVPARVKSNNILLSSGILLTVTIIVVHTTEGRG
jgi:hypothetical protein